MKNKIEDLRDHLFETLEALKDGSMDIERAKAIADVAGRINESAKIEVQFLSVTGAAGGSGFIPEEPREPKPLLPGVNPPRISRSRSQ